MKLIDQEKNEYIALTMFPKEIFGKITWRDEILNIKDISEYKDKSYCYILSMDEISNSPYSNLTRKDILEKYFVKIQKHDKEIFGNDDWQFISKKWPEDEKSGAIFTYMLIYNAFQIGVNTEKPIAYP